MNRTTYCQPQCETIYVKAETCMQQTSRNSEVGNSSSSNANKDHYSDPTGPIQSIDGGESLSKRSGYWGSMED